MRQKDTESGSENRLFDRRSVLTAAGGITGGLGVFSSLSLADNTDPDADDPNFADLKDGSFDLIEATVAELRAGYTTGEISVRSVVEQYLDRIKKYDDIINSIITENPHALSRADALDAKRESSDPDTLGTLFGIPIILKDNYDTGDIPTTAGSVSLKGSVPPNDAYTVAQLRDADGVILAKANLHEFAFGYDTISSLGGQTRNPYAPERIPGGSSGGPAAAIAANFGTIGMGTDTGGSIRVPAAINSLVGLRPTTALVSTDGIVPLTLAEDTAGPMTRTVSDTAVTLDIIVGYDPADPETAASIGRTPHANGNSYTDYLNIDGLEGACLGVIREYVGVEEDAGEQTKEGAAQVTSVFNRALEDMKQQGATIVDPVPAPPDDLVAAANVNSDLTFNRSLNKYLKGQGPDAPDTLAEIVQSGLYSPAIKENIRERENVNEDALDENIQYLRGLSKRDDLRTRVLQTMAENKLDALVYPTLSSTPHIIDQDRSIGANAQLTPALEFPAITVPAGFTAENELPVGIQLTTRRFTESRLIELAYSYEQATKHRRPPDGFEPLTEELSNKWVYAETDELENPSGCTVKFGCERNENDAGD